MFIIPNQLRFSRKDFFFTSVLPPLLVFLTLMILIGMSWRTAEQDITEDLNSTIDEKSQYIENSIYQRFSVYESALSAGTGLFNGSDKVSRNEWQQFVESLKLAERYPGIEGLGFAKAVRNEEKPAFLTAVRSEDFANYDLFPANDNLSVGVLYIVSTDNKPKDNLTSFSVGYDMHTEPGRSKALDEAGASGEATLSDLVNLSKVQDEEVKGFLLYVPLYKKGASVSSAVDRLQAVDGYIYAPFISQDLFDNLFKTSEENYAFTIYDEENKQKIFESRPVEKQQGYQFVKRDIISLYGQTWSIEYKAHENIVPYSLRARPLSVAIGGTIFAGLLAGVIYLLLQRRARSISYMEEKKLEEAKDELLSLASHQLRTPATAVKQYIAMVKDGFAGKIKPIQKDLLERAYESNERQLTIVDDLLYVARVDAGKANLRIERTDIAELTRSVINDQAQVVKERSQKIEKTGLSRKVQAYVDPHYVRMILENLLNNASKYSYEKTVIKVHLELSEQEIKVSFKDSGVGIDKRDHGDVFQKFTRIPNELSKQTTGSGIGLYLSYQLALLHGGAITFKSSKGKGSTFTLHIPRTTLEKNM